MFRLPPNYLETEIHSGMTTWWILLRKVHHGNYYLGSKFFRSLTCRDGRDQLFLVSVPSRSGSKKKLWSRSRPDPDQKKNFGPGPVPVPVKKKILVPVPFRSRFRSDKNLFIPDQKTVFILVSRLIVHLLVENSI